MPDGVEAPEASTHARTLAKLVRGKNIHEETLLATDYLNHFNEVIMLIGMIPDMPECLEDAKAWRPKSYEEHFRDSAFVDKDLAILAYENSPRRFRLPFDKTIAQMNDMVATGVSRIEEVLGEGNPDKLADVVVNVSRNLQRLVDTASAIIHGAHRAMDQAEIDSMLVS
ncbi:MAG TPA: hypothetical protein VIK47_03650 [Kiloniellales bacterium]